MANRDVDTARLWEGLNRAHNLMSAALEKDMLPGAGITLAWFEVLNHLSHAPGGLLRFQELAKVSGITDSGASRRLDHMIKAGLIERQECPTDRRGAFAHITAQGKNAHRRAHSVFEKSLRENLTRHLQPDELEVLQEALAKIP
jgi:DNA-binding MarR family transcriptional regulator